MNLVLIGYRGTGKTTISRLLSDELEMPCVSSDAEIVRRAGMTIPEIVERASWEHFRDLESAVVSDLAARDGVIIDAGGGVVLRPANVEALRRAGFVVLLEAAVEDIVGRIGSDTQRPSLTGAKSFTEEVEEVLAQREPLYRAAAHHVVDTSRLEPGQAARQIAEAFRKARG